MEKKITKKIIVSVIVFTLLLAPLIQTRQANAATSTLGNYYSNPNQTYAGNAYKFKISDVINSSTLTAVVGCTGVVNKVAEWMTTVMQSPFQTAQQRKALLKSQVDQISKACAAIKSGVQTILGTTPLASDTTTGTTTAMESQKFCEKVVQAKNDDEIAILAEEQKDTAARDLRTQCFDGIAISLAKNQLTSMTRSAMNWVNTGFGGNPFFVQNAQNLINNISENVVQTGVETLLAPKNPSPYAQDFARAAIAQRGIVSSSAGMLGSLTSDLENFVTDPRSIYSDTALDKASNAEIAEETAYNAKLATESFANNFSLGGWNAWLALTQKEQNNPLGFNMLANQYLSEMQTAKITETNNELAQNNGFMSQKICDQWQMYDKEGKMINAAGAGSSLTLPTLVTTKPAYEKADGEHEYGTCFHFKTITPGSLIKDKISNYLESPERQLELVKTINDSLNALFSVLISKFEGGGLVGLSDSSVSTNWTDSINSLRSNSSTGDSSDSNDNSGAYGDFNLTRDLGNTYIHDDVTKIGTWDAQLNLTDTKNPEDGLVEKLYADIAPVTYNGLDASGNAITVTAKNVYYEVINPGKTKLITNGYNSWQKGDRAFWDGEKWQNWKSGQQSPIKNRGVIQIQQDYIVAAKEILKVLPGVMPALGKLDYCLPGPNPSYKANSSNAQQAFSSWINSTYVGPMDSSGERFGVKVDGEGDSTFETLKNTYPNNNVWASVATEKLGLIKYDSQTADLDMPTIFSIFSNICNSKQSESLSGSTKLKVSVVDIGKYLVSPIWAIASIFKNSSADNCRGDYTYAKNGALSKTQANNIGFKTKIQEYLNEYVNNYLFSSFYDVFDKKMDEVYFKKMTEPYIEHEDRTLDVTNDKNPAYIPMAQSGLDFVKDIATYGSEVATEQTDYQDSMSTAKSNISRLEPIKAEVSKIITDAQNRRYQKLADLENTTIANIKTKYKSCFDEENVQFYDADKVTDENEYRTKEESCNDGTDNDLDGLVDSKDPDCGANTTDKNITPPRERRPSTSDDLEE